jgi:hypothetical protein
VSDIFVPNADRSTDPHDIERATLNHPTDGSRREVKDRCLSEMVIKGSKEAELASE